MNYYRWVLINHQETCYCRVVKLLDGLFQTEEDVKRYYCDEFSFKEHIFGVRKLDFSETPDWIAYKTSEVLENN